LFSLLLLKLDGPKIKQLNGTPSILGLLDLIMLLPML
jgi:hypothetical protein